MALDEGVDGVAEEGDGDVVEANTPINPPPPPKLTLP